MINKKSRLYRDEDYTIPINNRAHEEPLMNPKSEPKPPREYKTTQINSILKSIIKERMFGEILQNQQLAEIARQSARISTSSRYYTQRSNYPTEIQSFNNLATPRRATQFQLPDIGRSLLIRDKTQKETSRRPRYQQTQQKTPVKKDTTGSVAEVGVRLRSQTNNHHESFISSIQMLKTREPIQTERSIRATLPQIGVSTARKKVVASVPKSHWKSVSVDGRLSKSLLHKLVSSSFTPRYASQFFRFFQPPIDCTSFKYNQFVDSLSKLPKNIQLFFCFQFLDFDKDGLLTVQDLFAVHHEVEESPQAQIILQEIYNIKQEVQDSAKPHHDPNSGLDIPASRPDCQTLLQYLSMNHDINVSQIQSLLEEQHKPLIQSQMKKYTAYESTFLVMEHNEDVRLHRARNEQIRLNMQKGFKGQKIGITFEEYEKKGKLLLDAVVGLLRGQEKVK